MQNPGWPGAMALWSPMLGGRRRDEQECANDYHSAYKLRTDVRCRLHVPKCFARMFFSPCTAGNSFLVYFTAGQFSAKLSSQPQEV